MTDSHAMEKELTFRPFGCVNSYCCSLFMSARYSNCHY